MMRDERGLVLLEVLVGLAVSGILIGGLVGALYRIENGLDGGNSQTTANRAIDRAMEWVGDDIMMAATTSPSSADCPDTTTMTFTWNDRYAGNAVVHTSTYALSGTDLQRTYDSVPQTIASGVSALCFTRASNDPQVTVAMTVISTAGTATATEAGTYTFYMRPD